MAIGSLAIVILLHVPYVRRAGVWPYGEYQLYEAMADAFIPLFDAVDDLVEGDLRPRFTFAISPVLAEQLTDLLLRTGFEEYMLRRLRQVEADSSAVDTGLRAAARVQHARDVRILESWVSRHHRDLMATVRRLEREGVVESAAYPATGAVLPILPRVSARRGQIALGMRSVEFHMEHPTLGMWLPGGAIAPGAEGEGIGDLLAASGVEFTLVGERATRTVLPGFPGLDFGGAATRSPLDLYRLPSGLVTLVKHGSFFAETVAPGAFPAHPAYLGPADPYGRRYWVRGAQIPRRLSSQPVADGKLEITVAPGHQDVRPPFYRFEEAEAVTRQHAAIAAEKASELLRAHKAETGRTGVLVLPMDARLFGSWAEGPRYLAELVRRAREAGIKLESGAEAVHHHNLQSLPEVHPSSWEGDGDFRTWQADNTTWYWDVVASTLDHAESLADRFGGVANPVMVRLQAQATREALLLMSGEWAEMIGHGGEELDYAAERVRSHHDRFRRLAYMLDTANPDEIDAPLLERYEALDNVFENIDLGLLSADHPISSGESGSSHRPWGGGV